MEASVKLFKSVLIKNKQKKRQSKELIKKLIPTGVMFTPQVIGNYSDNALIAIAKEVGLSSEEMNNSFHKSWGKIKNTPIETLVLEQIAHYLTTYGFETLGIYNESCIYIPAEKLDIPNINEKIFKFTLIKGLTKQELKEKTKKLLDINIALKDETIENILKLNEIVELNEKDVNAIKNKEIKIALMSKLNMVPEDPTDFLRLALFKSIKQTLIIKNKITFGKIKTSEEKVYGLFELYRKKYGYEKLAEIFYRFKPLFLAFRNESKMKPVVNKIRRLANKFHKALPVNYINSITEQIKKGNLDLEELKEELDKVSIFKKIKVAYALKYRTKNVDSIVYKVRNGKGYVSKFSFDKQEKAKQAYKVVLDSIAKDLSKKVKGKKIFIPEYINYALPATEKQFVGNFPAGTSVSVDSDISFGVHWNNVNGNRIDLDLSVISLTGKYGWDRSYRNTDSSVLFSGDMTDASGENGASELFYIKKQLADNLVVMLNSYNHSDKLQVPYSIFVGKEYITDMKSNYMINPNNIVGNADSVIKDSQMIIGLVRATTQGNKFFFCEYIMGKSRTSTGQYSEDNRKYLFNYYTDTINFKDVLESAGAKIVNKCTDADIDLSPEKLDKTTIINLLVGE